MRILIDVIPFDKGKSGISAYARNVTLELVRQGHEITLLAESDFSADSIAPNLPVRVICAPRWTRRAALSMLWHLFFAPSVVRKSGTSACLLLAANRRAFASYPIPTVAVVHDLSQYHVEAKYDAFRMFYIKHLLPIFVRRADCVVAISESTKRDLVQYWKVPAERISVVYDGFTPPKLPARKGNDEAGSILYISRLEHPGKNHVGLIEAYGKLPRELAERHHLVLVGGDWNGAEAVHAAADSSPYRDLIEFKGFVPNGEMANCWAEASAYVFPSRFEGFGLSLLEAMSAGVPCACSSTSSLGELGEGVAELFDPESTDQIATALERLLTGDNSARIAAGRKRAADFSWQKCAEGLLAAFSKPVVFDVPIDTVTMDAAVAEVMAAVARPADVSPAFFAFVNAHCLNIAFTDEAYRNILKDDCNAVWPDGRGVKMAGNMLSFPVPDNVNGTDMFPLLCAEFERCGRSMFFFGGQPGVAEKAAENVRRTHPKLNIVGVIDGYQSADVVVDAINRTKPDLVLVALGVPLQEKWIAANIGRLGCRAAMAVGGLLDFASGKHPRAPLWMRRRGLEWLHRLSCEPIAKFRRYVIGNPLFLYRIKRCG